MRRFVSRGDAEKSQRRREDTQRLGGSWRLREKGKVVVKNLFEQ
jgi:hypothetical protein